MGNLFFELTLILCIATLLAFVFRAFKQPPILAYILTGMMIGPLGVIQGQSFDVLQNFSELGITLLLFLLGLELKLHELKSIGRVVIIVGILQVLGTVALGFGFALLFGLAPIIGLYLGAAIAFSSTIIVVKLLSDQKDIKSLHGKLAVGILLMQDVFAILFLMILSGYKPETSLLATFFSFLGIIAKGIILFAIVALLSKKVVPHMLHVISQSQELLFLFSLAWVFGVAGVVSSPLVGFSIEIGGFLAGISLANAVENIQIVAKVRPLRDFFVTMFFVFLGAQLAIGKIETIIIPAIVFTLLVVVIKPLLVMGLLSFFAYRKRTSFFTGLSIAQISEFSFIIMLLGNKAGTIPPEVLSMVTFVGIVSFVSSSYAITHINSMYVAIGKHLGFFEWRKGRGEAVVTHVGQFSGHIVLIGATRMGHTIIDVLGNVTDQLLVVDFDPVQIERLTEKGIPAIFGDIIDSEIAEHAGVAKAKFVISTISDMSDNLHIIKSVQHLSSKPKIIVVAYDTEEARTYYGAGADYVVMPHIASGKQIARALKSDETEKLEELREKEKEYLLQ
jgi:Kef-type K+ transport system membrane component KefB